MLSDLMNKKVGKGLQANIYRQMLQFCEFMSTYLSQSSISDIHASIMNK